MMDERRGRYRLGVAKASEDHWNVTARSLLADDEATRSSRLAQFGERERQSLKAEIHSILCSEIEAHGRDGGTSH